MCRNAKKIITSSRPRYIIIPAMVFLFAQTVFADTIKIGAIRAIPFDGFVWGWSARLTAAHEVGHKKKCVEDKTKFDTGMTCAWSGVVKTGQVRVDSFDFNPSDEPETLLTVNEVVQPPKGDTITVSETTTCTVCKASKMFKTDVSSP